MTTPDTEPTQARPPQGSPLIQFRLGNDGGWLASRAERMHSGPGAAGLGLQAKSELGLLRGLLELELRRVPLTREQACCLVDVLNGSMLDTAIGVSTGHVFVEVYDAFRLARRGGGPLSSYAAKWGIDEQALLDQLVELGPTADHALRDAISRWWEANGNTDRPADADSFRAVGITIVDPADEG